MEERGECNIDGRRVCKVERGEEREMERREIQWMEGGTGSNTNGRQAHGVERDDEWERGGTSNTEKRDVRGVVLTHYQVVCGCCLVNTKMCDVSTR